MSIKYTSNGNNKWGLVNSEPRHSVENIPNYSGRVMLIGLVLVGIVIKVILVLM